MIVIDDNRPDGPTAHVDGDVVLVEDVLAACAEEAGRIALAAERLDASMGALLSQIIGTSAPTGTENAPIRRLAQDLQAADCIRQELSGLARTLDLVVAARSVTATLRVAQVRGCTPLGDLQRRLLSHRSAERPQGGDA